MERRSTRRHAAASSGFISLIIIHRGREQWNGLRGARYQRNYLTLFENACETKLNTSPTRNVRPHPHSARSARRNKSFRTLPPRHPRCVGGSTGQSPSDRAVTRPPHSWSHAGPRPLLSPLLHLLRHRRFGGHGMRNEVALQTPPW